MKKLLGLITIALIVSSCGPSGVSNLITDDGSIKVEYIEILKHENQAVKIVDFLTVLKGTDTLHSVNGEPSEIRVKTVKETGEEIVTAKAFHNNGLVHRDEDKPARTYYNQITGEVKTLIWSKNGETHRTNGPAILSNKNGGVVANWYLNGSDYLYRAKSGNLYFSLGYDEEEEETINSTFEEVLPVWTNLGGNPEALEGEISEEDMELLK